MTAQADEARGALLLALRGAGIRDLEVLRAMETVPREEFLPHRLRDLGSRNIALPIACGQIMPPPVSLALMFEALAVRPEDRVLEIGTGTGYATAILARLGREVVSFERYRSLATEAEGRLRRLGVEAHVVVGDGLEFPAQFGRFDKIIVHATLLSVPRSLEEALAEGGRIVAGAPGDDVHPPALMVYDREEGSLTPRRLSPLRLPPLQRGVALAL